MKNCQQPLTRAILLSLCFLLAACNPATKEPNLYVLNPKQFTKGSQTHHQPRLIGIDAVILPEYLDNPQLMIFTTPHQSNLLEHDQWAEPLSSNIQRVLQTNLIYKLPNSAVELAPWDSDFYPQFHLRVEISQFKVDLQGNSVLQAIYTLEGDNKMVHQYQIQLYEKLAIVNPTTIVLSMNNLINQLSDKIAATIAKG